MLVHLAERCSPLSLLQHGPRALATVRRNARVIRCRIGDGTRQRRMLPVRRTDRGDGHRWVRWQEFHCERSGDSRSRCYDQPVGVALPLLHGLRSMRLPAPLCAPLISPARWMIHSPCRRELMEGRSGFAGGGRERVGGAVVGGGRRHSGAVQACGADRCGAEGSRTAGSGVVRGPLVVCVGIGWRGVVRVWSGQTNGAASRPRPVGNYARTHVHRQHYEDADDDDQQHMHT